MSTDEYKKHTDLIRMLIKEVQPLVISLNNKIGELMIERNIPLWVIVHSPNENIGNKYIIEVSGYDPDYKERPTDQAISNTS